MRRGARVAACVIRTLPERPCAHDEHALIDRPIAALCRHLGCQDLQHAWR
jgi:hypothetical protein